MEIDAEKMIYGALSEAIREGVKAKITSSYNSPLQAMVEASIIKHSVEFRELLESSIATCIKDTQFREDIAQAVRHSLAKTLIQRFGGEMEKQVNVLKSDPTTRARITLAIEEIVKQQSA